MSTQKRDTGRPDAEVRRSEKVERLLERQLPWILRHGTLLVLLAFAAAAIVLAFTPYPHGGGESVLSHFLR